MSLKNDSLESMFSGSSAPDRNPSELVFPEADERLIVQPLSAEPISFAHGFATINGNTYGVPLGEPEVEDFVSLHPQKFGVSTRYVVPVYVHKSSSWPDAEGTIKLLEMRSSLFDSALDALKADEREPADLTETTLSLAKSGSGTDTRYTASASNSPVIPADELPESEVDAMEWLGKRRANYSKALDEAGGATNVKGAGGQPVAF